MSNKSVGWLLVAILWLGVFGLCLQQLQASAARRHAGANAIEKLNRTFGEINEINRKINVALVESGQREPPFDVDLKVKVAVLGTHQKGAEERHKKLEGVVSRLGEQEFECRIRAVVLAIPLAFSMLAIVVMAIVRSTRKRRRAM